MDLKLKIASTVVAAALISGCVIGNQTGRNGQNVSVTLGNVEVERGERAGHLETVNGNIEVEERAVIESAETVNGNIDLGDFSKSGELETVNGRIEIGEKAEVDGDVETVNGEIYVGKGSQVLKDITITNGDVIVKSGAKVFGNIVFDHTNWSSLFESKIERTLEIEKGAELVGDIILYSPVELILPDDFDRSKIDNRMESAK